MHRDMQASLTFWSAFERRVGPADPDTDRFLVSDGSCGRSVGSLEIADALMAEIARRGKSIAVVRTGCDGRCFASVRVTFQQSRQPVLNWRRVDLRDIPSMIDAALQSNAAAAPDPDSEAFFHGQRRQLLADAGSINPESFEDAIRVGTYRALAEALTRSPADVVESIQAAGLLGMGGAYFPSWRKWQVCAGQPAPRYLVVNGEEGEPGVFKDRHLMEDQPHRLLEGAFIAAYAIGASQIYVFINGQARLSIERMQRAIDAVYRSRCVGESVLGTDFSCDVEIREGAGGYVLGEESVILESIEGYKPMPRFRPPHVAEHGLWGHPTVVNNVETLSRVPAVIRAASQIDSESTVDDGSKTKLISVTGDVQRPGLVEVSYGTTLREVVFGMAGGPRNGTDLKAVLAGGPSGSLVPPSQFNRSLAPDEREVFLGSGNLVALDRSRSLIDVVRGLTWFNARESCGKCTPCREGARRLAEHLDQVDSIESLQSSRDDLIELSEIVKDASLCGLGKMAPAPLLSALQSFAPDQVFEGQQ